MSELMRWSYQESLEDGREGDPTWFSDRQTLPSCGTVDYFQPDPDDCFKLAYQQGTPAELVSRWASGSGDSWVTYWRVLGPGQYETFRRFRDPGVGTDPSTPSGMFDPSLLWTRSTCTRLDFPPEDDGLVPSDSTEDPLDIICTMTHKTSREVERVPDVARMRQSYLCVMEDDRPTHEC